MGSTAPDVSDSRLFARAARRRNARRAIALAAKALVPGLALAVALAGAWRLTGGGAILALVAAAAGLPFVAAAAASLVRGDALALRYRAAAELDRRTGLDGLLATGLEISRGGIRTALAPAALRRAHEAASSLAGSEIPLAPPAWARYLSLPAALLVAILALPAGAPRPGRAYAGGGPTAGGVAPADETRDAADRRVDDEARAAERREVRRAVAAYKAERRKELDRAKAAVPLPPAPRIPPRPRDRTRGEGRGARPGVGRPGDGAGDGEGGRPGEPERAGTEGLAGAEPGPVDLEEFAAFREHVPEYEDLIRRYFAGG